MDPDSHYIVYYNQRQMTFWHWSSTMKWCANLLFVTCQLSWDIQNSKHTVANILTLYLSTFSPLWTQGVWPCPLLKTITNYFSAHVPFLFIPNERRIQYLKNILDTPSVHFILSVNLLGTYYVPGTVWDIKNTKLNNDKNTIPVLMEFTI